MQLPRIRLATPILAEEAIFKRKPVLSVEGYQHLYTLITKLPTPLCLCGEELSLCVICGFSLCPLRLKAFFRNFGSRYAQRELPEILYQHCLILFTPGPVNATYFPSRVAPSQKGVRSRTLRTLTLSLSKSYM